MLSDKKKEIRYWLAQKTPNQQPKLTIKFHFTSGFKGRRGGDEKQGKEDNLSKEALSTEVLSIISFFLCKDHYIKNPDFSALTLRSTAEADCLLIAVPVFRCRGKSSHFFNDMRSMPCNINCTFNLRYLYPLQGRYICISSLLMLFNQINQNVRATVSTDWIVYKGLPFN